MTTTTNQKDTDSIKSRLRSRNITKNNYSTPRKNNTRQQKSQNIIQNETRSKIATTPTQLLLPSLQLKHKQLLLTRYNQHPSKIKRKHKNLYYKLKQHPKLDKIKMINPSLPYLVTIQ